jgi:hypothetical protein
VPAGGERTVTEEDLHRILAEIIREEQWEVYNPRLVYYILTARIPNTDIWFDLWVEEGTDVVVCDRYWSHPLVGGEFKALGHKSFDIADPTCFQQMIGFIKDVACSHT